MVPMAANPNAQVIKRFYDAFARRDGDAMASCYHEDVVFSDPAFGVLHGKQVTEQEQ